MNIRVSTENREEEQHLARLGAALASGCVGRRRGARSAVCETEEEDVHAAWPVTKNVARVVRRRAQVAIPMEGMSAAVRAHLEFARFAAANR